MRDSKKNPVNILIYEGNAESGRSRLMIEIIKLAHEEGAQVVDMCLSSHDSSRSVYPTNQVYIFIYK